MGTKYLNMESSPLMVEMEESRPDQELATAVSRKGRTKKTSLVINDAIIVIVEFLQILAVIQSMSLRWTFPDSWIQATNFVFLFNLDIWEFVKVHSGAFKGIQNYNAPSQSMPLSYDYLLLVYGLLLLLIVFIFLIVYIVLRFRRRPYLFVHTARMLRALTIMCQLLSLPFGVMIFKLFHCTSSGSVDVLNELQCFSGLHWAYIIPSLLLLVGGFVVFPVWMIYRIRREVLAATTDHHESYLQLKEMEYMSGLDVIWVVKGFHLFSSFKLKAVWYRPIMQTFKLLLLIVYAAAFSNIFIQALVTTILLVIFWLILLVLRPFRLTSFNVVLIFSFLCLIGDATLGACMTAYEPSTVASAWLVPPYIIWMLASINGLLVFYCIMFVIHLFVYHYCCYRKMGRDPLWPSMASKYNQQISKESKKYMYAVLKGRAVLEKCRTTPALFAPVDELTQQIQIINAFFREAEKLEDGLHDTLWDLLDEMIDTHKEIEPKSLFSNSIRESIRTNAEEFVKLMPMFSRRLAQRDYDFILVSPVRKRILMKMSIVAMFINSRKDQKSKKKVNYLEMEKMWPKPILKTNLEDAEYCYELYPDKLLGPDTEEMFESSTLQLPLELMDIDEDDETESTATLLRPNSVSDLKSMSNSQVSLRSAYSNKGYVEEEQDQKLILNDYEAGESNVDNLNEQASNLISLLDEPRQEELVKIQGAEIGESSTDIQECPIEDKESAEMTIKKKKGKGKKSKK